MVKRFFSKHCGIILLLFLCFFSTCSVLSQQLSGYIYFNDRGNKTPLEGAAIYWQNATNGSVTNQKGFFELPYSEVSDVLVVSYLGFETKKIKVLDADQVLSIVLIEQSLINDEIEIKAKKNSIQQKFFEPSNTLKIDESELLKAACCNLSEAFETNPAVDVYFEDALSGVKQIKLLGLESPYILITQENIPFARGATKRLGLSFIPGTWINGMELSQGAGSVVNGFESMVGQINTSLKQANQDEPFFINLFGAVNGRYEVNTHLSTSITEQLSTALFLHGNTRAQKIDRNDDGFLDAPLSEQLNFLHRLQYQDSQKGWVAFLDTQGFIDTKDSGQIGKGAPLNPYLTAMDSKGLSVQSKLGYVFPEKPYQSFGLQTAYSYYNQSASWGLRNMMVNHQNYYANFIFQSIIGSTQHKFKTGVNVVGDVFKEQVEGASFDRKDVSAGVFFEYQYDDLDRFSYILGIRTDYHNQLNTFISPRLHIRYIPWDKGVFKLNVGQGRRIVNVFMENQKVFASSRTLELLGNESGPYSLNPEIAWNYGLNFTQRFNFNQRPAALSLDVYRTDFLSQVLADYENPQKLSFYKAEQQTQAFSFQIQTDLMLADNLGFKMAYKYQDIAYHFKSGKKQKPFTPYHRFFMNAAYEKMEKDKGWKYDATLQFNGEQRLPSTSSNPEAFRLSEWVDAFAVVNLQITRVFNKELEWYVGIENLFDYRQKDPILNPEDPFGSFFDTTFVYAPIVGRMIYSGVRWKF